LLVRKGFLVVGSWLLVISLRFYNLAKATASVGRGSPKEAALADHKTKPRTTDNANHTKRAVSSLNRHVLQGFSSNPLPGVGRGSPKEAA
jgi:hypothetical protein